MCRSSTPETPPHPEPFTSLIQIHAGTYFFFNKKALTEPQVGFTEIQTHRATRDLWGSLKFPQQCLGWGSESGCEEVRGHGEITGDKGG